MSFLYSCLWFQERWLEMFRMYNVILRNYNKYEHSVISLNTKTTSISTYLKSLSELNRFVWILLHV